MPWKLSARSRSPRSVFGELPKLDRDGQHRGGARNGAGRKPKNGLRAREAHARRPALKAREPVHVTLRVLPDVGRLRRRDIYRAVRLAMTAVYARSDFRIIHLSIQHDHVHLIVEADDARALSAGMSTFESVAARLINDAITKRGCKRTGSVFADRYHEEIIRTPTQARNALRYVINNWRKHGEDRDVLSRTWRRADLGARCAERNRASLILETRYRSGASFAFSSIAAWAWVAARFAAAIASHTSFPIVDSALQRPVRFLKLRVE